MKRSSAPWLPWNGTWLRNRDPEPVTDPQFDLFVPYMSDLAFRDMQETMERPFFSLATCKRLKPVNTSPDGSVHIKVYATPEFGMVTI